MAKREVKKVISSASLADAEAAMATVANVNSRLKVIEGKKEQAKQKVDEQYQDEVNKLNEEKKVPMETLEVFAKADVKNWENKSYDLTAGTIGFRTGTPKLDKEKGFTWEAVTKLAMKYFPKLVRRKFELNKESIIALRNADAFKDIKAKCMVKVVQDETFFVTTKEEELVEA